MSFIYSPHHGCNNASVVTVVARFRPDGANAPILEAGRGVSVTYSATGQYLVTLADRALTNFISGQVSLGMAAPNGSTVTFISPGGVIYDASNRRVTIQALAEAGTTVALTNTSVITVALQFTKSTLPIK